MTAKEHNRLVGVALIANAILQTFLMIFFFIIWSTMLSGFSGEFRKIFNGELLKGGDSFALTSVVFMIIAIIFGAFFLLVLVLPQIIGGWKLIKEKTNARNWGIVGSILSCLSFPIGTVLGIYGLWFLFSDSGKNFYLVNNLNHNMFDNPPQPQNLA